MDNEEQSGMEFFVYFLIFIAVVGLLAAIFFYEHPKAYSIKKVEEELAESQQAPAPAHALTYSGEILPYEEHSKPVLTEETIRPCDPVEIGCGVTYYHDGVPSKE